MDEPASDGKIESLEKRLYERGGVIPAPPRHRLTNVASDTRRGWQGPEGAEAPRLLTEIPKSTPMAKKILIGSIIFFIIAVVLGLLLFLGGQNTFSPDNIDLSVTGPVSLEGGKELTLQILMTNKNASSLESAELAITYPDGTKSAEDPTKDLPRYREYLGSVPAGEVINKSIRAILYGEEGSVKNIKVTLEYRAPGSNAIFQKAKDYSLAISSSPVNFAVSMPRETNTNQEITLSVKVGSNSSSPVENLLVEVSYPPGFSFKGSEPAPTYRNNVWLFPSIAAGKTKEIQLRGVIEGQNDEIKTFKVSAGLKSMSDEQKIGTVYNSMIEKLVIRKPYVGVDLFLNGSPSDPYIAGSDQTVRGDIAWTNNLADPVYDAEVTMRFTGQALDKASVSTGEGGFYQSVDNVVLWDKSGVEQFATMDPGASGKLSFSFSSLPLFSEGQPRLRNPEIGIELTIHGTRVSGGKQREPIETTITRKVRIATSPQLASRAVYSMGPFVNSGPLPPKAETQTTYTIIWSVTNSSSDVSGTTVEAVLPPYVKWLGAYAPQSEKVEYDPVGGKVRWNVGILKAGTGVTTSAREVSFQVAFTPSVSQVQTMPTIVSDAVLEGTDDFTGIVVKNVRRALTTQLSSDPAFKDGSAAVTE